MKRIALIVIMAAATPAVAAAPPPATGTSQAAAFLKLYNSIYTGLYRTASEASWIASTDVGEAHEAARTAANTAAAVFGGDRAVIDSARAFLANRAALPPIEARELDKVLLGAAEGPGTIPAVTAARVAAESRQASVMDGFTFHLDGKAATANDRQRAAALPRSAEAPRSLGGVERDRQAAETGLGAAAKAA